MIKLLVRTTIVSLLSLGIIYLSTFLFLKWQMGVNLFLYPRSVFGKWIYQCGYAYKPDDFFGMNYVCKFSPLMSVAFLLFFALVYFFISKVLKHVK